MERLFETRVALYRVGHDDVTQLARRFSDKSDQDALVLVPPSVPHFKLHALRSVVLDFKCFPLTDHGMIEWATRMEGGTGNTSQAWHRMAQERGAIQLTSRACSRGGRATLPRPIHSFETRLAS